MDLSPLVMLLLLLLLPVSVPRRFVRRIVEAKNLFVWWLDIMEAAAAVIVEALLAKTMIVIVVAIRKIFVVDKLHNMTERCGGVVWALLLGIIVIQSIIIYNLL